MKGWLDNFGKANNANESNVSMSEDFVGLGYNTKGRNYSPAWGGQFEQGGIIPIAQNGVSKYMENKMQEKKDATIAKDYDLPEVVVSAPIMTKYNDPDKLTGYPQYIPKSGDNTDIPGWDMAEFYKSWVSSPEYERRMKNTGYYEDVPGNAIYRKEGSTIRPQMAEWLSSARESRMGALESVQEPGFIQIEPSYYKGRPASRYTGLGIEIHPDHTKTPEMFETVLAHEIGHAIDSTTAFEDSLITSTMLPFSEFNKSFYTIDPVTGNYQPINQKDDIRRSQALHIRNDPQEFKSDLNALRYLMFDKGVYDIRKGKEFTKEDLERAKEKLKGNQSLDRTIQAAGESGLIKLMNVIAKGNEEVAPIAMNGASMPGSVGFTYARVAGAAPSKGKYAKKTMASAQNGQEMRFYQNGLDWKPKSMQNGGDEIKFNPLTNEYELPEVVVGGKDERIKNAMSQGIANLYGHVGELMGAPQKEMMQLITGKEQTPSQAWGFQKPGGWLDSYSSFGKNAFNFGLDALGDPVNAIPGVGMVDDIGRLSLKGIGQNLGKGIDNIAISQAPSPQMMADNVLASSTPNASTVPNQPQLPYTELDHPHMDLLQELKQKTIDRIDTPEGRRRLQYMINKNFGRDHKSWGKPVESWGEFFLHGFKSGQLSGQKKLKPDDIIEEIRNLKFIKSNDPFIDADNAFAGRRGGDGGYGPGSVAAMYMGENNVPGDIRRVFDHEMGHIFQRNRRPTNLDDKLSELELKKQPSSVPDSPLSEEQLEDVDFSKSNQQWGYGFYPARDYFLTGSGGMEKLPFAAEVRQSLLRRGKIKDYYDEITPQMIEDHYDLYNKTGGNKSILRLYEIMEKTPKNFKILSETLNNLPSATLPIAGGAAATISALQNQQPVQKQRNGGITKDNLGYWNPDNWGKPVEIDSNDITMEGVYEPLLGISDTGDTKLMQPGKNYKFNGKKVTEFPVAQTGINWLEKEKDARTYLSNWLAKREKQLGENMGTTNPRMVRQELGNQLQNIYDTPISYDPLDYAYNSVGIPKLREKIEKEPDLEKRNKMYDELESLNKEKDLAYDNLMSDFDYIGGSYSPYFNSIFVKDYLEPEEVESAILHELTHALNYSSGSMLNYNRPYTHNINPGKDIPQLEKIKKIVNENRDGYYDNPTEIYSRLMEFRKKNKLNPSKTYTIDDIKDLRDRTENWFFDKAQDYNLFERYTDDQILKLINDVASGKKQKMPVGKLGINELDAQPMKKLNQLLNFTNNPDKDNWLDKYN